MSLPLAALCRIEKYLDKLNWASIKGTLIVSGFHPLLVALTFLPAASTLTESCSPASETSAFLTLAESGRSGIRVANRIRKAMSRVLHAIRRLLPVSFGTLRYAV